MKARILSNRNCTLQAVATFGLVAPMVPIETTQSSTIATPPSHVAEGSDAFAGVLSGSSGERETSTAINFPIVGMPDKATGKRFLDLVDREAKNIATRREIEECRIYAAGPSYLAAATRFYESREQHQLIRNLWHSLTRYVEFVGNAPAEPSSTRARAKSKA